LKSQKQSREEITPPPLEVEEAEFGIYVFNNKLSEGENFILTDTLIPIIEIKNIKKIDKLKSISLDKGPNILTDRLSATEIKETQDGLLIKPRYAIAPKEHVIDIVTLVKNQEVSQRFSFVLLIKDNFNSALDKSKLWIIPESTKERVQKSWYIENNRLKIDSLPQGPHVSLAFLYTFDDDITIDFYLKSLSEVVNLLVYFLESDKSIIIGNGNNYTTWILHGSKADKGDDILIDPGFQYRVRVVRDDFTYKLFVQKTDKRTDDIIGIFSEMDPVLVFVDERPSLKEDHIGFALWSGSGGVEIDDVVITGYAIY